MYTYNTNKLIFSAIVSFGLLGTLTGKINKKITANKKEKKGRTAF